MITYDRRVKTLLTLATTAGWLRPPADDAIVVDVAEACSGFFGEDGIKRRPADLIAGLTAISELAQRITEAVQQGGWASEREGAE